MSRLDTVLPIVAAPMAGGPTTVALAHAVQEVGGFPFLAAGYQSVDALAHDIRQMTGAFGVNIFVPGPSTITDHEYRAYAEILQPEAAAFGVELPESPHTDDDGWNEKLDLLHIAPVPAVSFTFGLPDRKVVARLHRSGTQVLATVTTPDEARAATELGVDSVIVQGPSAGGHSATFDPRRTIAPIATSDLVRAVRTVTDLPIVAAGGVDGPNAVQELLDAGSEAVAVGTLLLRTDEAGTSNTHRTALTDSAFTETVLTHAFTGRPARGLRNAFVDKFEGVSPFGYPEIHHLTRPLRQAASRAGDADSLHLWAGTGYRAAPTGSAREVIQALAAHL